MKQLDEMNPMELGKLHSEIESRLVEASRVYPAPTSQELTDYRHFPNTTTLGYAKRILDNISKGEIVANQLVWLTPMARCRLAHETHS